jgi:hypothetical protein
MATFSLQRLWTIYKRTAVDPRSSKRDLARTQLAFYSGARGVLKVLAYLIEHGDYEELHETIKRYGRQFERFERGVRRRDVIDPDSAKSLCLCHADGGTCRQEAARRRRVALRGEMDGYRASLIRLS